MPAQNDLKHGTVLEAKIGTLENFWLLFYFLDTLLQAKSIETTANDENPLRALLHF